MKEIFSGTVKIVARFLGALLFIACCVIAILFWTDLNRDDFRNTEPANYVDSNKTRCEVHGETLQIEKILQIEIGSRDTRDMDPNDTKLFPYSNKWLPIGCGLAPSEAIVQFCEKCRKAEFLARQREELEKDLKAHNLWHELPQH